MPNASHGASRAARLQRKTKLKHLNHIAQELAVYCIDNNITSEIEIQNEAARRNTSTGWNYSIGVGDRHSNDYSLTEYEHQSLKEDDLNHVSGVAIGMLKAYDPLFIPTCNFDMTDPFLKSAFHAGFIMGIFDIAVDEMHTLSTFNQMRCSYMNNPKLKSEQMHVQLKQMLQRVETIQGSFRARQLSDAYANSYGNIVPEWFASRYTSVEQGSFNIGMSVSMSYYQKMKVLGIS